MKLVVQIPCFNEEECISDVIYSIPKKIKGIDEVEIFVLNDGSDDKTSLIANKIKGVNVVESERVGLAKIFQIGLTKAVINKADIVVNIDGDNQYNASDIEKLIEPILLNEADIVIGTRPIDKIKTFSPFKKMFQKFGSFVVKVLSDCEVKDAASGFRAFSKKAILSLNIFNNYTYTIESLIQAKSKNLKVKSIDIGVNVQTDRKSKLFKNIFSYMLRQSITLIRYFIIYQPAKFFGLISFFLFLFGFALGVRFLYFYFNYSGSGHIQSLILCSIFLSGAFILFIVAILGDLISINRKLLEEIQYKIREKSYKN